ncbi:MAG TPA: hypothetical protein HPP59_00330 [Deltaproteobacteria bacterium]|nr:hypothetical protein [Deltaproteobacteria bacterium]
MFTDRSITFKLVMLILLSAGAIFAAIFAYNYHISKHLFMGVLNIRTGKLIYCSGGHNPPV